MKHRQVPFDVPARGDAVLVIPKATAEELVNVLGMAVLSLADVLRHQPTSYVFRVEARPELVFSEPAPRPLIELLVDLLDATEQSVRLEALPLAPVMRLSRDGVRIYIHDDGPTFGAGPGPLN